MPRRRILFATLLVAVALLSWFAAPYVTAAAFVLDLAGTPTAVRRWLPVRTYSVTEQDTEVPTRYGAIPARVYRPGSESSRSIVVFPGVHAGGVDEPRLAAFCRRLAGTGAVVLSVPLPELRRYRITPVSTDMVEDAAAWMAANRALSPRGVIDVAGVSFAGGLALVAAGRPRLKGAIAHVVALGGHADLPRVMTFLCTGRLPDGSAMLPHDYGVVITLLAAIPKLVPAEQVAVTRNAVLDFLDAESFDTMDPSRSAALRAQARTLETGAPEPARSILSAVDRRDIAFLGPKLMPYIEELGGAAALSPDRSPATGAPVFLLHGEADNVIPAWEAPALAGYLRQQGNRRVDLLLTPLISHADVQPPRLADALRLIRFWKDLL